MRFFSQDTVSRARVLRDRPRRGEFVGEIALLEQTPRTATVTAKTPLRVFVLTNKGFGSLLDESPSVEGKVLRTLARRVVELSKDPTVA